MNRILKIFLVFIAVLLVLALVVPFLIPVPELTDTVPVTQLTDPDSRFVEIDGLQVHYKSFGSGEPVFILLHGFASSVYSWDEVTGPLSEIGQVIAFDRPAFGLTERPLSWQGQNPYTPEFQVDLVVKLMDALGIDQAILIGNSAGGTVAMNTYLQYPERIEAMILVSPAVYSGGGAPAWIRPLLNTPQMDRLGPLVARSIQSSGRSFAESAWHDPSKLTDEMWQKYTKPLRAENWDRALWALTKVSANSQLPEKLDSFNAPVLVITGDDDRIVPTTQSVRLAGELPNAQLVVVPECGHVAHEECPTDFMRAVRDFLERIE